MVKLIINQQTDDQEDELKILVRGKLQQEDEGPPRRQDLQKLLHLRWQELVCMGTNR